MRISYGKLRVPVHRIAGDDVLACEVSVEVLGENFLPAYTEGDNSQVVATDTMKNFILRESLGYNGTGLEGLLLHLGQRFLATYPVMEAVRMSAKELRFDRLGERVYSRSTDDYGVATVEPDGTVRGGRHGHDAPQDPRQRVHEVRPRRVHDAARARRPPAVHPLDVDWRYAERRSRRSRPSATTWPPRSTTSSRSRSSTSSTRWGPGCWPTTRSSPRSRSRPRTTPATPSARGRAQGVHRPVPRPGADHADATVSLTTHVLDTARASRRRA